MAEAIRARDVFFEYGSGRVKVEALRGVDLFVPAGEIFGFLGPNGAGKTTAIKIMLGMLFPVKGHMSLFGSSPGLPASRRRVGYMPEIANYYAYLTPRELLIMYGRIFGLDKVTLKGRIDELLISMGLEKVSNRLMGTFSKGMMQKVSFAQSLINDPDLLILDEPTSGLDPVSRKKMRETLQGLREKGKTIFFSSHELSEAELICDSIGILDKGKIVVSGPIEDIIGAREQGETLESHFLKMIGGEK
jgi:ABC-2 type transport system ATP-binding protein